MNLNRYQCIARLTKDPEAKTFGSGAKKVSLGLAVNERYKGKDGEWKDSVVFLDAEAWSYMADRLEQEAKGSMVFLEGKLKQDTWDDKQTGAKRSKIVMVVETCVPLAPRKREPAYNGGGQTAVDTPF